jgi:drug/metabolite transporter (DMT)-like permease
MTPNRRGILAMVAGMCAFVTNDTLVKYVSQSLPAAQLILLRGVFASLILLTAAWALGLLAGVPALRDRRVLLRAAFDACATFSYLLAVFNMPLANATAINMATPLVITLFAILAFGERVGPARWAAIVVGFLGVLLVVQPAGDGFNGYALLCLAGTLLHAARDLMTRTIPRSIPSVLVTLSTALAVTLFAGAGTALQGWAPVAAWQLGLLAAASLFLSAGYYLLIVAMRDGEMSLIAPFRYSGLLFALVLGYAVWGDVPNLLAWCGIVLLVGAGLHVLLAGRPRPAP